MASVVISGDTSGTVTLQAPGVAGNTTLTLPTANGTVLTTASGQTLTSPTITSPTITGAVMSSMASSVITTGTSVPSTSGTSVVLSGIPSWAKRVTIIWNGVTCSANTTMVLNSITSGYSGTQSRMLATGTATNAISAAASFAMTQNAPNASYAKYTITLSNASTFLYMVDGWQQQNTNTNSLVGGVTVGAVLSSVTFAGGTFSAGEMAIFYE